MKHTCRCTCTAYGGACDCAFDAKTQERLAVVAFLRTAGELQLAQREGATPIAAMAIEMMAQRLTFAADAIARGEHTKEKGPEK